ncbi:hypothetical protein PF008_g28957 [Phytophthora fragariae]|uniref:LNR domain-containing protein n=1 Tax=Phytophthora fragariae TaxID=53985 RepID=A0A6G0Q9S9_9STRA|nr:hypothetical protein PF008_g28957 [Phytophthora fragariae]
MPVGRIQPVTVVRLLVRVLATLVRVSNVAATFGSVISMLAHVQGACPCSIRASCIQRCEYICQSLDKGCNPRSVMTTVTVSEASFTVVAAPGTLGRPALTSTIIILTSVAAQRRFPG